MPAKKRKGARILRAATDELGLTTPEAVDRARGPHPSPARGAKSPVGTDGNPARHPRKPGRRTS